MLFWISAGLIMGIFLLLIMADMGAFHIAALLVIIYLYIAITGVIGILAAAKVLNNIPIKTFDKVSLFSIILAGAVILWFMIYRI